MTDLLKTASQGVTLVGEIMKAAGDNPQVKEAGSNLGQAALTITKTINNALLPLAAVNFAFDKARKYFDEKFSDDLSQRVSGIPVAHLAEPKASIAGPALQGLSFTHEEPRLKDMYISLIATAMDNRVASKAHPAFVEIIRQLDATEAALFKTLVDKFGSAPYITIVRFMVETQPVGGHYETCTHVIDFRNEDGSIKYSIDQTAWVENWIRLGLLNVNYDERVLDRNDPAPYEWVKERPEYMQARAVIPENSTVRTIEGSCSITAFGKQFASAAGLTERLEVIEVKSP